MAVHLHFNSWYISLPSSVKQQHEMTRFCVVWRTRTTTADFAFGTGRIRSILSRGKFWYRQTHWIAQKKMQNFTWRCPRCRRRICVRFLVTVQASPCLAIRLEFPAVNPTGHWEGEAVRNFSTSHFSAERHLIIFSALRICNYLHTFCERRRDALAKAKPYEQC